MGNDFTAQFDKKTGALYLLDYGQGNILKSPIKANFWRAPVDNDFGFNMPKKFKAWKTASQNPKFTQINLQVNGKEITKGKFKNQSVLIKTRYRIEEIGGTLEMSYTLNAKGEILVDNQLKGIATDLPKIPRLGNNLVLDNVYQNVSWYGRGPYENYQDRNTASLVASYDAKVKDLYYPYIRPQENGYKTDVREVSFIDKIGNGIRLIATKDLLGFSAHHQLNSDFDEGYRKIQRHDYDIPQRKLVNINVDYKQMGIGGDTSWGALPHDQYMIPAKDYQYSFLIQPIYKLN